MKAITVGLLASAAFAAAGCSSKSHSPTGPGYSVVALPATAAGAVEGAGSTGGARQGFGFNGTVSGFPAGAVFLTGGGSFDAATASNVVPTSTDAQSGGGFRCVEAVAQGPLAGCETGQGVRWDTAQLLDSIGFKCSAADAVKPARTGPGIVVLLADFYRAGNGNDASFTAQIIVADHDIAPNVDGEQTLWVQGVGCGDAIAHFNR
jgi:hypothetical protein